MRWVEPRKTIGGKMKSGPRPGRVWNGWNDGFKHFDVQLVILVANIYVGDDPNCTLARLPSSFKCYQELSQYHLDLTQWHLCCESTFPIISETIISVPIVSQSPNHHLSSCWPITGLSPCTGATVLSTINWGSCWPAHQSNLVNVHKWRTQFSFYAHLYISTKNDIINPCAVPPVFHHTFRKVIVF